MRILLTEEALQTQEGHFLNYLSGIARGLRQAGDTVDLLAHESASPEVIADTSAIPWFRRNCRNDPRSRGLSGFLPHNYSTYQDLVRWLEEHSSCDWLLNLATRRQQLVAFTALAYNKKMMPQGRILLLFVLGFGVYGGRGAAPIFRKDPSTLICRFLFWSLRPAVRSGRVVLAAETLEMKNELELFCGLPIEYLPHPVNWSDAVDIVDGLDRRTKVLGPANRDRFVVTCPGFARCEKGSDLLLDAINELDRQGFVEPYFFLLQWLGPFTNSDGKTYAPDEELERRGVARFISDPLNSEQYRDVLEASDAVILPYRADSYHNRVSRVAIEAAALGVPLIYTKGTWIEEVARVAEVGIPIKDETKESIVEALTTARQRKSELRARARSAATSVREFYSIAQLRERMLHL